MTPDSTLGGYFEKHSRPPAFEGSDGASYSVDLYINEEEEPEHGFVGALLFVRWSPDGAQPVSHLETDYLVTAVRRADVKAALHALTLHEVKDHLERLIEKSKGLRDW
ncbi:MAG: hypothetical protein O7I93_05090 [Gemmatimonadetes bacterium]|nr:hypothetical protein [Gemmatimonadota bacterium]